MFDAMSSSSKNERNPPKPDSALKMFVAGGIGGACAVLVGHPFDLVKVQMQTGGNGMKNATVISMLQKTLMNEGIRGIYRGVSAPLAAATPMFAVSFWGYDIGKRIIRTNDPSLQKEPNLPLDKICMAAAFSSLPATFILAPSERIKCLLQVQANNNGLVTIHPDGSVQKHVPRYSGMVDCAIQVYRQAGLRGVFRGTFATLLRDVPGTTAWFVTYEWTKRELMKLQAMDPTSNQSTSSSSSSSSTAIVCAGGLAGMACWIVSISPDVLKSRYQTAPDHQYRSLWHVFRHLMKEEGPLALFRGLGPAMIRAFPANAACFMGMEIAREALSFLD